MTQSAKVWYQRKYSQKVLFFLSAIFLMSSPLFAQAHYTKGDLTINWDSTASYGVSYRVTDPDLAIIGVPNEWNGEHGTAYSVNGDDGNLNYDGIFANVLKYTTEIELRYKQFGMFVRGYGFYDTENEDGTRLRTELTDGALDRVGSRAELLDAFIWFDFDMGSMPVNFRLGRQVLSWGESTYIQNGINAINPIDVSAIRVPGAELKEAFLPVGMAYLSMGLTENITFETFYQYEWEKTHIDPPGSYFSTNDFAGAGGEAVFIGFSDFPDIAQNPITAFMPYLDHQAFGVPRLNTREADDDGQYGAAIRVFAPALNETEFGFYYMNYHSRLPTINATTGSMAGVMQGMANAQITGGLIYQHFGVGPGMSPEVDALVATGGKVAVTDTYLQTAGYWLGYPEDISLYGVSFNTMLGSSGIALQGEVSYRQDMPLQVDDVELLFAALSPISDGLALTNQVTPATMTPEGEIIRTVGFESDILGYRLHDVTQIQMTATKAFGPMMGADMGILLGEVAYSSVSDMPDKSILRYEGPGTLTSGNPIHTAPGGAHAGKPYEDAEHFADDASSGLRLAGRLDYTNVIGGLNFSPKFSYQYDISGVSPGPGGNFIEGRQALMLGLDATYQNSWRFSFTYSQYMGAGRYNLINDRDFISFNTKYSF